MNYWSTSVIYLPEKVHEIIAYSKKVFTYKNFVSGDCCHKGK